MLKKLSEYSYIELLGLVEKLTNKRPLTPEERADWAYGQAKLSNEDVTLEMAEAAVRKKQAP